MTAFLFCLAMLGLAYWLTDDDAQQQPPDQENKP